MAEFVYKKIEPAEVAIATTHAKRAARYLLWAAERQGIALSNLELLKILYYSQGWFLALYGRPLFDDQIEAWSNGPVISAIYGDYKQFGYHPILGVRKPSELSPAVEAHLDVILDVFGRVGGVALRRMTHSETPWLTTREGLSPNSKSRREIPMDRIKAFFVGLAHGKIQVSPLDAWAQEALRERVRAEQERFIADLKWVNEEYGETLKRLAQQ